MGNIFNHNRLPFSFRIDKSEYWDFHLSQDNFMSSAISEGMKEDCLSAYINAQDDECCSSDCVYSKKGYSWSNKINKGVILTNIGLTGVDNGLIKYQKDRIDNTDFIDIYTNSTYTIPQNEERLILKKVEGNNQIFNYNCETVKDNDFNVIKLNGGFYQGFFKSGCDYQLLPTNIGHGWSIEFTLKKDESLQNEDYTLNDRYPQNKGIFFYIGTRAENKWWVNYNIPETFQRIYNEYFAEDYTQDDYLNSYSSTDYFTYDSPIPSFIEDDYFIDDNIYTSFDDCDECWTLSDECKRLNKCKCYKGAFPSEYLSENIEPCDCLFYTRRNYFTSDIVLDTNSHLSTKEGHDIAQPNVVEFETDNKFLLFDHTCDGFTADTWIEGSTIIVSDIQSSPKENYFLLYNQTCDGLLANKRPSNKDYNVLSDLYRNAFALQIKDDGSVGYKYLIQYDNTDNSYRIESEFSHPNVIENNKWFTLHIKIVPIGKPYKPFDVYTSCSQKMKLYFYINGRLFFVSKELPIFNFKQLNDMDDKQESVPFNISIGGGTQGLCDVVYYNFRELPKYVLPLEKEFGGTFIGYFKTFRFYDCALKFSEIIQNTNFEQHYITY